MRLSEDTIDKVVKWFNGLPETGQDIYSKSDTDYILTGGLYHDTDISITARQFQRIRLERCGYKKKAANGEGGGVREFSKKWGEGYPLRIAAREEQMKVAKPEHVFKVGDKARVSESYESTYFKPGEVVTITGFIGDFHAVDCLRRCGETWLIDYSDLEPLPEPAQRTPSAKYSIIDIDGYTVSAEYKLKDNRIVAYPVLHTPDGKIIKPKIAEEQ